MFLFKTSGQTLDSVIKNQKHAFAGQPRDWQAGESVLVSKNRTDCTSREKQIQFLMVLDSIRELRPGESEQYWPGTEGRWRYLVQCRNTVRIRPFNLQDAIGVDASQYGAVVTFARIRSEHEKKLISFLKSRDPELRL